MGARVTGIDANGVDVTTSDRDRAHRGAHRRVGGRACRRRRWPRCSPKQTGAEVDRAGRIATLPDLTLPGHPEVFAVGDMVTLERSPWRRRGRDAGQPARGQHDRAPLAAARTRRCRTSTATSAASPPSGVSAPSAASGRVRLSGFAGWVVWMFVHLAFLNGWGNRFTTMMRWLRWLVGRNRVERVFSVGPHRRRPQRTSRRAACHRARPLPRHDQRQGGRRHRSVTSASASTSAARREVELLQPRDGITARGDAELPVHRDRLGLDGVHAR